MYRTLLTAVLAASSLVPAAASAQSFQGPYVGVQAGWNHDIAIADKKDSVVGGVFAGYDHEVAPNIVLGAEGGFSLGASDRIGPSGANAAQIDPLHSFDLSARAGYVVGGDNLLYVRGGYENSRARFTSTVANSTISNQRTLDGWFVGGGVERKLLENVSARVEYRYSDLGYDDRKFERHQVLAGVAYRF
ncbi:outer membrane protein [Sphingobium nicotianae]|uniref:Porin family protein n=1 Tax=Sphingobium nicotianae TaxID=2782607 RepID=A0A9X1DE25_9SPHN|nr:outer membrane protein [Sphingobium nicotianae]MBT2188169.1 porin family protein [Sphingobium nicotianae]